MGGFVTFCMNWYWLFIIIAFFVGVGVCGYVIDAKGNVIEIDNKKKELMERNRDMSSIKTQFKDKSLSLNSSSGAVEPAMDLSSAGASSVGGVMSDSGEDLSAPLNINLH